MKTLFQCFLSPAIILALCASTQATVYFLYDAESGAVGATLPYQLATGTSFDMNTAETFGTIRDSPLQALQGTNYFGWDIKANQHDAQAEGKNKDRMPFTPVMGTTYYMAYFF